MFISASIGISTYPADGQDGTTLLKNADAAMYRAKEEGRNTFRFYSAELDPHGARSPERWNRSCAAPSTSRNSCCITSPRWTCRAAAIVGVEALVRWQHPQFGLISPLRFIPAGGRDRPDPAPGGLGVDRRLRAAAGVAGERPAAHHTGGKPLAAPVPASGPGQAGARGPRRHRPAAPAAGAGNYRGCHHGTRGRALSPPCGR